VPLATAPSMVASVQWVIEHAVGVVVVPHVWRQVVDRSVPLILRRWRRDHGGRVRNTVHAGRCKTLLDGYSDSYLTRDAASRTGYSPKTRCVYTLLTSATDTPEARLIENCRLTCMAASTVRSRRTRV